MKNNSFFLNNIEYYLCFDLSLILPTFETIQKFSPQTSIAGAKLEHHFSSISFWSKTTRSGISSLGQICRARDEKLCENHSVKRPFGGAFAETVASGTDSLVKGIPECETEQRSIFYQPWSTRSFALTIKYINDIFVPNYTRVQLVFFYPFCQDPMERHSGQFGWVSFFALII